MMYLLNSPTRYIRTNKKNILTTILTSAITAGAVTMGFQYKQHRIEAIEREDHNARFAGMTDLMLSGRVQRSFVSSAPTNFIAAAAAITPSVVNIKALNGTDESLWNSGESNLGTSSGSGVIISADGYVITNNHVVEGATDIEVALSDKRTYDAKLVGFDASTDLALLKIDMGRLTPVRFGNSDSIRVGEWVLAVGNPFNLESTVTAGIVSAKGRSINILEDKYSIESFIQTDAAVNPGNSGGALVNTNGELVGINTAIITKSGRYEGYSFAIPVNLVMKIVRDLKTYGVVQRGFLGVSVEDLSPERAKQVNLDPMSGVYISKVNPGSAAEDGNIKEGDVVISVNGSAVRNKPELLEMVARHRPGDKITLEYMRLGKKGKTNVTLKNKNNTTALTELEPVSSLPERLGFAKLQTLNALEIKKLGTKGVRVLTIGKGSKLSRLNMEEGFVMTHINDIKIESVEQFIKILEKARPQDKITIEGVYENFPDPYFFTFTK
jgi:serine protease Do